MKVDAFMMKNTCNNSTMVRKLVNSLTKAKLSFDRVSHGLPCTHDLHSSVGQHDTVEHQESME